MKPYGKGHLILVDAEGKVVAHSVSVKWEEGLEDLSEEAIFKESEKKQKGVAKYISKLDKAEKIGAYYNLSNGWKIWISRDVKEIEKTISSLFPLLFYGGLLHFS